MLAPYAVRVEDSRGRRYPEPPHPYRNAFSAGPRSRHPRPRLSPPGKQDAGLHPPLLRPLSYPPDAHHGGGADLAHHRRATEPERRSGRRPWRWCTTSAIRPSDMPASARSIDLMRRTASSSTTTCRRCASSKTSSCATSISADLNLTFEVREGIIKHSHDYSAVEHPRTRRISARPAAAAGSAADRPDRRNRLQHRRPRRRLRGQAVAAFGDSAERVRVFEMLLRRDGRRLSRSARKAEVQRSPEAHAQPLCDRPDREHAATG